MEILDKKTIKKVQKILKSEPDVLAAYFFGSQVAGFASKKSDLDLAIVVKDKKDLNELDLLKLLASINFPKSLDLCVVDKNSSPFFLFEIISQRKRIYEKDEDEATSFEAGVLKYYYDTRHLRNIYRLYLKESLEKGVYGY